ncbi:MAG: peptide chain release factor 1 [Holosporales bacterium]
MIKAETLARILDRQAELTALLSDPVLSSDKIASYSKELSDLEPVVVAIGHYRDLEKRLVDAESMLGDTDLEMRRLAEAEFLECRSMLPEAGRAVQLLLLPKDIDDERSAIMEFRPAAGGEEAALFAGVLLRMYMRYADRRGWKHEILSFTDTGLGGIKEASVSITGRGVFARLKFESGVHRVQRVPETEASGRVHTSTATVAVLPEVEEVDIQVNESDLRIDTYRASGAGGQHVNKTDSAVRITHIPSGVVVAMQEEKSQHKNKAKAMKILRAKLYEAQRAKNAAGRASDRRDQVGTGDRSERIRTYNFPQGRVTDHRSNITLYQIDTVVEGDLEPLIDPLLAQEQSEKLAMLDGDI